jgi:DNA repair protein RadC
MRSKDSCPVLRGLGDSNVFRLPDSALEQEHMRVILLDRRNRVMETVEIYKGSVNSSQVRVGEVFKEAIRKNASALIVIHNHPSGAPRSM